MREVFFGWLVRYLMQMVLLLLFWHCTCIWPDLCILGFIKSLDLVFD